MSLRSIIKSMPLCQYIYDKYKCTAVSLSRTFLFNIKAFPLKIAFKFPVWVYQGVQIEQVGKIVLTDKPFSGQIRIGNRMFFRNNKTSFINRGTITFNGPCTLMGGCTIHLLRSCSHLICGDNVMVGENVNIICDSEISIGDFTRIAFGSLLIDSEFHFLINIKTGDVKQRTSPIFIGRYNWIGNKSTIKKGTKTPDYCIVSNGSMLTRDFSSEPLYSLILGSPAKVVAVGFRRIYNEENDIWLCDQFQKESIDKLNIPVNEHDLNYNNFCNGDINVLLH